MNNNKIQIIKDDEIDLKALFQVLWNERKRIVLITILVTIIGIRYALIQPPLYKSTISIYPSGAGAVSKMAEYKSMVSAFGISAGVTQKLLDIGDILSSRSLQKRLIYHEWNSENWNEPVNLIAYWEINDSTKTNISLNPIQWIKSLIALFASKEDGKSNLDFRYEMASIGILSGRIEMEKSKTGLYNISVWMEEKRLAADLANVIYDVLVEFITIYHVNKARMNREFIQERLQDVSIELEDAEESLKIFSENNRSLVESPQLQLELGRHTRGVKLQSQLYMTLIEQFELIKIKELDETPTLTVLDRAVPPLNKDKPKRKVIVLISFMIGMMVSICMAIGKFLFMQTPTTK